MYYIKIKIFSPLLSEGIFTQYEESLIWAGKHGLVRNANHFTIYQLI